MEKISAKSPSRRMHYGYVIILCCCLMMGIDVGLSVSCAGIFYEPVSKSLGISFDSFGIYMSIMFICSSLMLSTAGEIMTRVGARKTLTVSSIILGLDVIAMGCFNSLWQFYLAGSIMGISLASLLYLSFPTLVNTWFRTRVGVMIGICSAASGIGGILFNPLGGWIITAWGWRAGYWVFGAIILFIVTPLIGLLLRNTPEEKGLLPVGMKLEKEESASGAKTQPAAEGIPYHDALRMPVLYTLVVFAFILMACSTFNLFVPKYVTSMDFNIEQSSLAAAAVMAGVTGGKLVLGWINDRNCAVGVLVTTLFGISGLAIMTLFGHTFPVILFGAFLFGWEYAGCTVQTAMLTSHVFGRKDYARIYAIISIALAAGGGLASGAWGVLARHTSFATAFTVGCILLGIGCALGLYALAVASRSRR